MQLKSIKVVNIDSIKEKFPDFFKEELEMLKEIDVEIEPQQTISASHDLSYLSCVAG